MPLAAPEAALAAGIYARLRKARGREIDLAISTFAISRRAELWTLNSEDFDAIPELEVAASEGM